MAGERGERRDREKVVYRRDRFTWVAFAALMTFGFLNAVLGPVLPFLRAVENISYLVGVLHQVAFALGGGLAGLAAARAQRDRGRGSLIRLGLAGAAVAGLALGYGDTAVITIAAAFVVSLSGTAALVRLWGALADAHGAWRTVAMAEGEVAVSFGSILAPVLVGGLAATVVTWRFAFVIGAVLIAAAILAVTAVPIPAPRVVSRPAARDPEGGRRLPPTLILIFAVVALEFSLSFWLASYLHDSVGLDRVLAATMVGGLYAANLLGRLIASRVARRMTTVPLLAGALATGLVGLPILLAATDAAVAAVGLAVTGVGIGATFPLSSSLHLASTPRAADDAVGQVLAVAAIGQIVGPVAVAVIAQGAGLRVGLLVAPALVLLGAAALHRSTRLARKP